MINNNTITKHLSKSVSNIKSGYYIRLDKMTAKNLQKETMFSIMDLLKPFHELNFIQINN